MFPSTISNIMNKTIIGKILLIFLITIYALFLGCPFYRLTGECCPGCGMSRAFLAAARLDFEAAFRHHPLYPLLAIETVYVMFRGNILKRVTIAPKTELVIGVVSVGLLWIVWIYRRFVVHTI